MFKRIVSSFVLFSFLLSSAGVNGAYAQALAPISDTGRAFDLPLPGQMVGRTPAFTPAHLKGMVIHPNEPFKFDFIIHHGDTSLDQAGKQAEYQKLIKYFLAALAVPDNEQWVNLSPYEKDRIIPDTFGKTEMGRDLLSQDYILKQISASLTNPDTELGKKFWDEVYARAYEKLGTTDIPTDTFNKVWIQPDKAVIYEKDNTVYVVDQHLKVMIESDYLAQSASTSNNPLPTRGHVAPLSGNEGGNVSPSTLPTPQGLNVKATQVNHLLPAQELASQVLKDIIIPVIEKEVNEGRNFAQLRQVYSGMLLAAWYKRSLKESILAKVYGNQNKVKGIDQDPKNNQAIYDQYVQAFKAGVFNMIKEDVDRYTNEVVPRKYFSGGAVGFADFAQVVTPVAVLPRAVDAARMDVVAAQVDFAQPEGQALIRNRAVALVLPGQMAYAQSDVLQRALQEKVNAMMHLWFEVFSGRSIARGLTSSTAPRITSNHVAAAEGLLKAGRAFILSIEDKGRAAGEGAGTERVITIEPQQGAVFSAAELRAMAANVSKEKIGRIPPSRRLGKSFRLNGQSFHLEGKSEGGELIVRIVDSFGQVIDQETIRMGNVPGQTLRAVLIAMAEKRARTEPKLDSAMTAAELQQIVDGVDRFSEQRRPTDDGQVRIFESGGKSYRLEVVAPGAFATIQLKDANGEILHTASEFHFSGARNFAARQLLMRMVQDIRKTEAKKQFWSTDHAQGTNNPLAPLKIAADIMSARTRLLQGEDWQESLPYRETVAAGSQPLQVLIKPDASGSRDAIEDAVRFFRQRGYHIDEITLWRGSALKEMIRAHYGISAAASIGGRAYVEQDQDLKKELIARLETDEAGYAQAKVFGGQELIDQGYALEEIEAAWEGVPIFKFGPGMYAGKVTLRGQPVVLINGHIPSMVSFFTAEDAVTVAVRIAPAPDRTPASVVSLRDELGDNNLQRARQGTLRATYYATRKLFADFQDLFRKYPRMVNGYHLSAQLIEAMAEVTLWGGDLADQPLAQKLLAAGLGEHEVQYLVAVKPGKLFKKLEDMNLETEEAVVAQLAGPLLEEVRSAALAWQDSGDLAMAVGSGAGLSLEDIAQIMMMSGWDDRSSWAFLKAERQDRTVDGADILRGGPQTVFLFSSTGNLQRMESPEALALLAEGASLFALLKDGREIFVVKPADAAMGEQARLGTLDVFTDVRFPDGSAGRIIGKKLSTEGHQVLEVTLRVVRLIQEQYPLPASEEVQVTSGKFNGTRQRLGDLDPLTQIRLDSGIQAQVMSSGGQTVDIQEREKVEKETTETFPAQTMVTVLSDTSGKTSSGIAGQSKPAYVNKELVRSYRDQKEKLRFLLASLAIASARSGRYQPEGATLPAITDEHLDQALALAASGQGALAIVATYGKPGMITISERAADAAMTAARLRDLLAQASNVSGGWKAEGGANELAFTFGLGKNVPMQLIVRGGSPAEVLIKVKGQEKFLYRGTMTIGNLSRQTFPAVVNELVAGIEREEQKDAQSFRATSLRVWGENEKDQLDRMIGDSPQALADALGRNIAGQADTEDYFGLNAVLEDKVFFDHLHEVQLAVAAALEDTDEYLRQRAAVLALPDGEYPPIVTSKALYVNPRTAHSTWHANTVYRRDQLGLARAQLERETEFTDPLFLNVGGPYLMKDMAVVIRLDTEDPEVLALKRRTHASARDQWRSPKASFPTVMHSSAAYLLRATLAQAKALNARLAEMRQGAHVLKTQVSRLGYYIGTRGSKTVQSKGQRVVPLGRKNFLRPSAQSVHGPGLFVEGLFSTSEASMRRQSFAQHLVAAGMSWNAVAYLMTTRPENVLEVMRASTRDSEAGAARELVARFGFDLERSAQEARSRKHLELAVQRQAREILQRVRDGLDFQADVAAYLEARGGNQHGATDLLASMISEDVGQTERFLGEVVKRLAAGGAGTREVVLASKSPRRRDILRRMLSSGTFEVAPAIGEEYVSPVVDHETAMIAVSVNKALEVLEQRKSGLIIASDTTVHLDDKPLGQLHDSIPADEYLMTLERLAGQRVQNTTSLIVLDSASGRVRIGHEAAFISLRELDEALTPGDLERLRAVAGTADYEYLESFGSGQTPTVRDLLRAYHGSGKFRGKAGGYGIQDLDFFETVQRVLGNPLVVVGMPTVILERYLSQMGVAVDPGVTARVINEIWPPDEAGHEKFVSGASFSDPAMADSVPGALALAVSLEEAADADARAQEALGADNAMSGWIVAGVLLAGAGIGVGVFLKSRAGNGKKQMGTLADNLVLLKNSYEAALRSAAEQRVSSETDMRRSRRAYALGLSVKARRQQGGATSVQALKTWIVIEMERSLDSLVGEGADKIRREEPAAIEQAVSDVLNRRGDAAMRSLSQQLENTLEKSGILGVLYWFRTKGVHFNNADPVEIDPKKALVLVEQARTPGAFVLFKPTDDDTFVLTENEAALESEEGGLTRKVFVVYRTDHPAGRLSGIMNALANGAETAEELEAVWKELRINKKEEKPVDLSRVYSLLAAREEQGGVLFMDVNPDQFARLDPGDYSFYESDFDDYIATVLAGVHVDRLTTAPFYFAIPQGAFWFKDADEARDSAQARTAYGGIDMNAMSLDMQIRRDGNGVPLPVAEQDLERILIEGLVPVILDIRPATSLPIFSGRVN
jgi:predicted house-cleaning NTP pyrophosphatase (Maf/HAM1 superfamily)